jgi:hypothetical protein
LNSIPRKHNQKTNTSIISRPKETRLVKAMRSHKWQENHYKSKLNLYKTGLKTNKFKLIHFNVFSISIIFLILQFAFNIFLINQLQPYHLILTLILFLNLLNPFPYLIYHNFIQINSYHNKLSNLNKPYKQKIYK